MDMSASNCTQYSAHETACSTLRPMAQAWSAACHAWRALLRSNKARTSPPSPSQHAHASPACTHRVPRLLLREPQVRGQLRALGCGPGARARQVRRRTPKALLAHVPLRMAPHGHDATLPAVGWQRAKHTADLSRRVQTESEAPRLDWQGNSRPAALAAAAAGAPGCSARRWRSQSRARRPGPCGLGARRASAQARSARSASARAAPLHSRKDSATGVQRVLPMTMMRRLIGAGELKYGSQPQACNACCQ